MADSLDLERDRQQMVEDLRRRGIQNQQVLQAMLKVPRHLFVQRSLWHLAYGDHPLPIGENQTISQPYIVALMTEALKLRSKDRVLEVGTGSGYQTAMLAELAGEVYTMERAAQLIQEARILLQEFGYREIHYRVGDGTKGWAEHAPYDRIIASGSVPQVPPSLIDQLSDPGRLVIPVGERHIQELALLRKVGGEIRREELVPCSFLPLIGEEGWNR